MSYCACGKLGVRGDDRSMEIIRCANVDEYTIVDENGNEVIPREELPETESLNEEDGFDQLMKANDHLVHILENLSASSQLSPCTNRDLLHHLEWESAVLKTLYRLLKKSPKEP